MLKIQMLEQLVTSEEDGGGGGNDEPELRR